MKLILLLSLSKNRFQSMCRHVNHSRIHHYNTVSSNVAISVISGTESCRVWWSACSHAVKSAGQRQQRIKLQLSRKDLSWTKLYTSHWKREHNCSPDCIQVIESVSRTAHPRSCLRRLQSKVEGCVTVAKERIEDSFGGKLSSLSCC